MLLPIQLALPGSPAKFWNSYAPMSQTFSMASGRGNPRWSVVSGLPSWSVHEGSGIASIAGLAETRAMVCVGPPLLARTYRVQHRISVVQATYGG